MPKHRPPKSVPSWGRWRPAQQTPASRAPAPRHPQGAAVDCDWRAPLARVHQRLVGESPGKHVRIERAGGLH
eukprot:12494709-Alexandrium_andersonii.AAC.1